MPLVNFGSVLNFAEELEAGDQAFYEAALKVSALGEYKDLFGQLALDAKKNMKNVQRVRRENVTEMILEHIKDFSRAQFVEEVGDPASMDGPQALAAALKLEKRAVRYYAEAAEKLKALSEVARALKQIGKKRAAHQKKLEEY